MKATLTKRGLEIEPETQAEAYALRHLFPSGEWCDNCKHFKGWVDKIFIAIEIPEEGDCTAFMSNTAGDILDINVT